MLLKKKNFYNPDHAADTIVGGYHIPKDTQIYYYSGAVHHTESNFKNHSLFHPERFLNEEGIFCNDEKVLYFGSGKRRYTRYTNQKLPKV